MGTTELQSEVLSFRRTRIHKGFDSLPDIRRCQIFTNLGNQLGTVGRFVDAAEYWGQALAIQPRLEKTKIAFRVAYSLFDKIAYFLNDYMRLGIPETGVYFRSLWYEKTKNQPRALRPQFVQAENWPWRGLYWLAKDFTEKEFRDVMEPDAQALSEIQAASQAHADALAAASPLAGTYFCPIW